MWAHVIDYIAQDRRPKGGLVSRGFWIYRVPRLLLLCRLFGHKAVVDGVGDPTEKHSRRGLVSRWVCCDRCGHRPNPQGSLDPVRWRIGDRYNGPWAAAPPDAKRDRLARGFHEQKAAEHYPPGPWGRMPTGELGGQLVIGGAIPSIGFGLKVGHAGSEQTLAGHVHLGKLGALYLHTERIGTWWQRRLNPVGYNSRVVELEVDTERLRWKVWARRNEWSRDTPRWMDGSLRINVFDLVLGQRRYSYDNTGEPVTATVRMPHGDDHQVTLQLQRVLFGRKRWRKRESWSADWSTEPGIPTKTGDRGKVQGSGVKISLANGRRDHADPRHENQWVAEACAAIAVQMTTSRTQYGYHPFPTERSHA